MSERGIGVDAPHRDGYPPIGDYAFIGDCRSAALISREASIDWLCLPRLDSSSTFGRLLDWRRGGYCAVRPTTAGFSSSRRYIENSLVLQTTFQAAGGEARLIDCLVSRPDQPRARPQLLRILEGVRGRIELEVIVAPRFDYGELAPWVRHHGPALFSAVGGDDGILIAGDLDFHVVDEHELHALVTVRAGRRARLSLTSIAPEALDRHPPAPLEAAELDRHLEETLAWWREWAATIHLDGADEPGARRSALVLKALMNRSTGAVAAAATTSLPEAMGGERNWDYRYSWVRDSQFTVRSLANLGCVAEAEGFRRFVERSSAGSGKALRIMYGLGGERRLTEIELDLAGYRGSRPVRAGNAASDQLQLDVYGYLLDLTWRWHQRGSSPDDDYWRFLLSVIEIVVEAWREPDRGIWEVRGKPLHFVHSKVMCWVAIDRGLRLAEECLRRAPVERWKKEREEIRAAVESEGYDAKRGIFIRSFGAAHLDAALLLLPNFDFVAYRDERMQRTTDAVREELSEDGLLRRYRAEDGLEGEEGVFVPCTFWLAECLAHQGRLDDARQVFDRAISTGNELGLFSEEYDPKTRQLLGNFPQGLTHLSHIAAAAALARHCEPG